ncbi:hypothetical protein DMJ13_16895 [halophilic archaeon]|nr:hypothetical protein DMJ13_16895 [halophilic archaeon]
MTDRTTSSLVRRPALAALGAHLLVGVAGRYVAEYLRILGARAWLVGLYGSVAVAATLAVPAARRRLRTVVGRHERVAAALFAAGGLALWLAAPYLGSVSLVVLALEPWTWVLLGLLALCPWRPADALGPLAPLPRRATATDAGRRARSATGRRVGLLGAVGVAAGLFVGALDFLAAYQVLVALAAAAVLTAAVTVGVFDAPDESHDRPDVRQVRPRPSLARARERLRNVSPAARSLLVGDALVRFAVGMVAVFLVVVAVHSRRVTATVLGVRLQPEATFALLLGVETLVALLGALPAARLVRRGAADAGSAARAIAGSGLLAAALFPLLFVTVPAVLGALAALFGALGWYLAARPARAALLAARTDPASFDAYRVGRRVAVAPAPLVGGLLYGVAPELAFGLASCVGLLGCWEYLRFARRVRA